MKHFSWYILISLVYFYCSAAFISADVTADNDREQKVKKIDESTFEPFTGKIKKQKVRMRLQPLYDGQILKEMNSGDMVIVVGESDDFFAVQPPAEFKGYVYRTYVLDNVIEKETGSMFGLSRI